MSKTKDGSFLGATVSNEAINKVDHVALEIRTNSKIRPNRSKATERLIRLGYTLHKVLQAEGLEVKAPPQQAPISEDNTK
jgi:hypothetical protein